MKNIINSDEYINIDEKELFDNISDNILSNNEDEEVINLIQDIPKKKNKKLWITKEEFKQAVIDYRNNINREKYGKIMLKFVETAVKTYAKGQLSKSEEQDLISDCIIKLLKLTQTVDENNNIHGYFSMIVWRMFLQNRNKHNALVKIEVGSLDNDVMQDYLEYEYMNTHSYKYK